MKMENAKFLALAMALASMLISAQASAATQSTGALSIANLYVLPQPVIAGQNVTLTFQLYNSYQSSLQNVNIYLGGSYPIVNYSPANTILIGVMGQGLYGGANSNFQYKVHIPKNTPAGTYTINVYASYQTVLSSVQNTTATSIMPITFYVTGNPNLVLTANPVAPIVPGQQSSVQIAALNVGTDNATNVSITVLQNPNLSQTGAGTFYLGTIAPKSSATATTTLQAGSNLAQGTVTFPVQVTYTTQYGVTTAKVIYVPLSVLISDPNIVASIVGATPPTLYSGSNQTLTVSLQNIGTGVAKNVTAGFLSTPNITVSSSASSLFVGTISPGNSVMQSILIIANKRANGTRYSIPVNLSYQNANYQKTVSKIQQLRISLQSAATYNITSESGDIKPGDTYVPVTFTIKNVGNQAGQHITISLQSIYPIAPVNTNQYIDQLAPGQSTQVKFYVNVDAQGNPGNYPVTVYEQWTQPNGATSQQYVGSNNYYLAVQGLGSNGTAPVYTWAIIGIIIIAMLALVYTRVMHKNVKKEKK